MGPLCWALVSSTEKVAGVIPRRIPIARSSRGDFCLRQETIRSPNAETRLRSDVRLFSETSPLLSPNTSDATVYPPCSHEQGARDSPCNTMAAVNGNVIASVNRFSASPRTAAARLHVVSQTILAPRKLAAQGDFATRRTTDVAFAQQLTSRLQMAFRLLTGDLRLWCGCRTPGVWTGGPFRRRVGTCVEL